MIRLCATRKMLLYSQVYKFHQIWDITFFAVCPDPFPYLRKNLTSFPGFVKRGGRVFGRFCLSGHADGTAKTPGASFRVSQKPGKGAFSVVTLRVATLKLPMPSFLRSIENPPAATFGSAVYAAVRRKILKIGFDNRRKRCYISRIMQEKRDNFSFGRWFWR